MIAVPISPNIPWKETVPVVGSNLIQPQSNVQIYQHPEFPVHPGLQQPIHNYNVLPASLPSASTNQHPQPDPLHNIPAGYGDGKQVRKAVFRKTIDYNQPFMKYLQTRVWQKNIHERRLIQPDYLFQGELLPPMCMLDEPMNSVCTRHVRTSTNKNKCPIFTVCWTPEGRRLITGSSSGEFTLWNGLTFNFETILQAHEAPIRCMLWSHNEDWLLTADNSGYVKYWQSNMNNVKMYQAHKDPVRGCSFCPSDTKFVTCSDDATVRIWDFVRCKEERVLRGHGADVRCCAWHPYKSMVISGSKDPQQPIKLWDPKAGGSLATLFAHKNTCTDVAWNANGNWLLTASRDHLVKLFDIRYLKTELQIFRGHKKDVMRVAWHPIHENLFASGDAAGSLMYWMVGSDVEVGSVEDAHEHMIWSLAWHPIGHIIVSGSNDFCTKFWTRNRPGEVLKETPTQAHRIAPHRALSTTHITGNTETEVTVPGIGEYQSDVSIPGIFDEAVTDLNLAVTDKKFKKPSTRAIPKNFQQNWVRAKSAALPSLMQQDNIDEDEDLASMFDMGMGVEMPPGLVNAFEELSGGGSGGGLVPHQPFGSRDLDFDAEYAALSEAIGGGTRRGANTSLNRMMGNRSSDGFGYEPELFGTDPYGRDLYERDAYHRSDNYNQSYEGEESYNQERYGYELDEYHEDSYNYSGYSATQNRGGMGRGNSSRGGPRDSRRGAIESSGSRSGGRSGGRNASREPFGDNRGGGRGAGNGLQGAPQRGSGRGGGGGFVRGAVKRLFEGGSTDITNKRGGRGSGWSGRGGGGGSGSY